MPRTCFHCGGHGDAFFCSPCGTAEHHCCIACHRKLTAEKPPGKTPHEVMEQAFASFSSMQKTMHETSMKLLDLVEDHGRSIRRQDDKIADIERAIEKMQGGA